MAHDTGVSLIRPLYYQWPNADNAYEYKEQYMFGEGIMVRPIVEPGDNTTLVRDVKIWLPQGCWYELGMTLVQVQQKEGLVITRTYDLSEVPYWVKERGNITIRILFSIKIQSGLKFLPLEKCDIAVPIRPGIINKASNFQQIASARKNYDTLGWRVYLSPDSDTTTGVVYQDDGITTSYLEDDFSYITFKCVRKANTLSLFATYVGSFGIGSKQSHWIQIPNVAPSYKLSNNAPQMDVIYDPFTLSLYLQLKPVDVQVGVLFFFDITLDTEPIQQVKQLSSIPRKMYRARVSHF